MTRQSAVQHVTDAIESIDTDVAALIEQIEQLQERVDQLGDARIELVTIRDRLYGSDPAPAPEAPQRAAAAATPARPSARRAATPPDPKPKSPARTSTGRKTYDLAEVARIACEAIAEGRSAPQAIVDQLGAASRSAASMAISNARKAGHDIPKARATSPLPATEQRTTSGGVVPFARPDAADVADLEAQAGLPT